MDLILDLRPLPSVGHDAQWLAPAAAEEIAARTGCRRWRSVSGCQYESGDNPACDTG